MIAPIQIADLFQSHYLIDERPCFNPVQKAHINTRYSNRRNRKVANHNTNNKVCCDDQYHFISRERMERARNTDEMRISTIRMAEKLLSNSRCINSSSIDAHLCDEVKEYVHKPDLSGASPRHNSIKNEIDNITSLLRSDDPQYRKECFRALLMARNNDQIKEITKDNGCTRLHEEQYCKLMTALASNCNVMDWGIKRIEAPSGSNESKPRYIIMGVGSFVLSKPSLETVEKMVKNHQLTIDNTEQIKTPLPGRRSSSRRHFPKQSGVCRYKRMLNKETLSANKMFTHLAGTEPKNFYDALLMCANDNVDIDNEAMQHGSAITAESLNRVGFEKTRISNNDFLITVYKVIGIDDEDNEKHVKKAREFLEIVGAHNIADYNVKQMSKEDYEQYIQPNTMFLKDTYSEEDNMSDTSVSERAVTRQVNDNMDKIIKMYSPDSNMIEYKHSMQKHFSEKESRDKAFAESEDLLKNIINSK